MVSSSPSLHPDRERPLFERDPDLDYALKVGIAVVGAREALDRHRRCCDCVGCVGRRNFLAIYRAGGGYRRAGRDN